MRRAMAIALPQADIERAGVAHMGRLLSGSTLRAQALRPSSGPTLKIAAGPLRRVVERREHLGAVRPRAPELARRPSWKAHRLSARTRQRAPPRGRNRRGAERTLAEAAPKCTANPIAKVLR